MKWEVATRGRVRIGGAWRVAGCQQTKQTSQPQATPHCSPVCAVHRSQSQFKVLKFYVRARGKRIGELGCSLWDSVPMRYERPLGTRLTARCITHPGSLGEAGGDRRILAICSIVCESKVGSTLVDEGVEVNRAVGSPPPARQPARPPTPLTRSCSISPRSTPPAFSNHHIPATVTAAVTATTAHVRGPPATTHHPRHQLPAGLRLKPSAPSKGLVTRPAPLRTSRA